MVATSPELVTQNFGGAAEARFTPAQLLEIKGMWCAGVNHKRPAMLIRAATEADAEAIWSIIGPTIRAGEVFAIDREVGKEEAIAYWFGGEKEVFVAVEEENRQLLGTYYLQPNHLGGGRHVANCAYATSAAATGRGIARAMCAHSLDRAKERGVQGDAVQLRGEHA